MTQDVRSLKVQVPTDLYDEFRERVPWGLRKHLFKSLIELITDAIRQDGDIVLGALLSGEYRLTIARRREVVQNLNEASK